MRRRKMGAIGPVVLILASLAAAGFVASRVTTSPVYSVAQVRWGLRSAPKAWLGRTVQIRALDIYPGGRSVAWLVDPADSDSPQSKGLPVTPGRWQSPGFPRSLVWWFSSNVKALRGIDGGRVEVYRITLTKPLRPACVTCSVGHG